MRIDFLPSEWNAFIEHCFFTDRELEIIQLHRRGWAIVDIAAELDISSRTVDRDIVSIKDKIVDYIKG